MLTYIENWTEKNLLKMLNTPTSQYYARDYKYRLLSPK